MIAPLYDFKESAVSLTFDDGYINQFTVGLPLLIERKLPATFYIVTKGIDEINEAVTKSELNGYEIGSHTVNHRDLVLLNKASVDSELIYSQADIKKYFGRNAGLTFCYPWGEFNNSVKLDVKNFYLAARATDVGYNSFYSIDRFALKMQDFHEKAKVSQVNSWVDYAIRNKLWLIEMIHGINGQGYSPVNADSLKSHLDYIKTAKDKIWCATVADVIKYIDEYKLSKIECDFCNDTVYRITINDFLDDSIYNQPLSIRIKVPGNWDSIHISNNEKIKTEYYNKSKFILFNALPDNNLLTIRPDLISVPEQGSGIRLVYLSANPFFDEIKFSLEVFDKRDIEIVFCDINGKLLIRQKEKAVNGVINFYFDTSQLNPGIYILKVYSRIDGFSVVRKMIKS